MNYNEALQCLFSKGTFGHKLGLERIQKILDKMGNPQNNLKFIHIAGTNGKGSTSTMLSNILIHSGYKTGLFISPYVVCFRERMQINGQMISEEEFASIAKYVYDCSNQIDLNGESLTQFETLTAIAFEWYKRKNCDYVCLEVGMGGRFDPTNIIPKPILQIITSISFDHTAILGDTIEKIAFEKAGIIKGGTTILYPLQKINAIEVIKKKCEETGSKLVIPDVNKLSITNNSWQKDDFIYNGLKYHKSLKGEFQIYNCITVIEAAKQLQNQNLLITDNDIKFGIENTYFPARTEVLSKKPLIILDGSHNSGGIKALEQTLKSLPNHPITIIMGVLADKNYNDILNTVIKYADNFIAVTPNNPRALKAETLCQIAKSICENSYSCDDLNNALEFAISKTGDEGALVVCGSLYLASEIRPLIISNKLLSNSWQSKLIRLKLYSIQF